MNPDSIKTPSTPRRLSQHGVTTEKNKSSSTKQLFIKKKSKEVAKPEHSNGLPQGHLELRSVLDGDPEVDYSEDIDSPGEDKAVDKPSAITSLVSTKSSIERTKALSQCKSDDWAYTLAEITQASTTEPMPSYEFLGNSGLQSETDRVALLDDMFGALGIADKAGYITYLSSDAPEVPLPIPLIPPLGHSVREWVYKVHHDTQAMMPNLFQCVQRPDPLSYPKYTKQYKTRAALDQKQAEQTLRSKVHDWNKSQILLANVLTIAMKKALELSNLQADYRRMLLCIKAIWDEDIEAEGVSLGHVMFWQMKGVLHREPKLSAAQLRTHINNYAMDKNHNGTTPNYIQWVKDIHSLAKALKEYDDAGVTEDTLLNLFMEKYRAAIDLDRNPYDTIISKSRDPTFNWSSLLQLIKLIDLDASVTYRTKAVLNASDHNMQYHTAAIAAATTTKIAHSSVKTDRANPKSIRTQKAGSQNAQVVQWAEAHQCAIHKADTRAGNHTNGECRLQRDIRTSGRSIADMIPQLDQIRKSVEKKEADRNANRSTIKLKSKSHNVVAHTMFRNEEDITPWVSKSANSVPTNTGKRKLSDDNHPTQSDTSDNESLTLEQILDTNSSVTDGAKDTYPVSRCPDELTDGFSDTSSEIRRMQADAEDKSRRRQLANDRRRSNKQYMRELTSQQVERNSKGDLTLRGYTLQEAAQAFVKSLSNRVDTHGMRVAKQRFDDLYFASKDRRRSGETVHAQRTYLLDEGLRFDDLRHAPKDIYRYVYHTLKVCTSSSPTLSIPLTYYVNSASSDHLSPHIMTRSEQRRESRLVDSRNSVISRCNNKKLLTTIHVVSSARTTRALLLASKQSPYDSIIDTGATSHILRDARYAIAAYQFKSCQSHVSLGDHSIQLVSLGTCTVGILRKALIVPKMSLNLISGSCLERDGFSIVVRDSKCTILNFKGDAIFHATLHDGLYSFNMDDFIKTCTRLPETDIVLVAKVKKPAVISSKLEVELLHKRFGHASIEDVISGLKSGAITGFTIDTKRHHGIYQLQNGVCVACMKAKAHKPPFYLSMRLKATAPGEYVVCDIQGPISVETLTGDTYVVTYTDWYSRYSWTFLLTHKSEALSKLKYLVEVVFKARRVSLRHYHSDQAGELQGSETIHYLEHVVHATHSESEAYTPARNSIAERKFRTLGEMTAAMLFDSGLPKTFWGYAYLAATHIRNRIPTVIRDCNPTPRSPYELWYNSIPNMHYIRRWGCKCFVYIPKQLRDKSFPDKVQTGFLIGFTTEGSYEAYIPARAKVVGPTVQIQFDEDIPSHSESYFEELHQRDNVVDTTDKNNPETPKDFNYLIGTTHIDDEDGLPYETTRITTLNNEIVAYRATIKADGKRNRYEDPTPIHVKDIARLTTHCPSSGTSVEKTTTGVGISHTLGKLTGMPQPHPRVLKSLTSSAVTGLSTSNHGISITSTSELSQPGCATVRSSPYNLRKRVTFNILSDRESKVRKTTCLTTRGHIASQASSLAVTSQTSSEPSSTFKAFHIMVERNEFEIDLVPTTYKQAMQSSDSMHWQEAINKELASIEANKVFSIVDRPPGIKLQTGRFLFKIKYTGHCTIYKARLIAHGFKQIAGSDYWETYAPVSSSIATRIFLTICATYNMFIHQMDIDTAFLIAILTEDLYMAPPVGMNVPEGKVLKLHKCLYGLKQSPRYFNQHLVNTLLNIGFNNLINEPCLFHKVIDGKQVLASIYVDDILIACSDVDIIKSIKLLLSETYKMKDMGEMDWYLGMRCKRNNKTGTITLDQTKYTEDVLTKFDEWIGSCKNRYVPMQPNLVLQKWTQDYDNQLTSKQVELIQRFPYRQIIGSLLYISIWTRPDISYAVGKLAKFNNHPTVEAIHATQWLLQYMQGTKQLGLTFIAGDMRISTYVDSSFSDVTTDKRSTAGQITYLGKSPIQWDSFVCDHYSIPCSVAEAEYIAASEAARVMLSNRNILIQLGFPQDQMFMFEDNQACISIAMQEASTRKTKHVELQVHHIRDLLKTGRIVMVHITTNIQLADIFTKPLNEEVFNRHLSVILGNEPVGDLLLFLNATKEYNTSVDLKYDEEEL